MSPGPIIAPPTPPGRIFLLSHMRAFTSLAGHILGSHPQINGYYEMHISYEDATALDKQRDTFLQDDALKPDSRYLFDKLLHNEFLLKPEALERVASKILLSLARPERTIKSIVQLYLQKDGGDLFDTPEKAAQYYIERIQALADFGHANRQGYFYIDAELWQQAPDRLLPQLTEWLELDSPLSERYQTFSQTGKPLKGDSSPRIHIGQIDKGQSDYSHISVPEAALNEARKVYEKCRRQVIDNAADALLV
jgi:hypothetical protein